MPTRTQVLIPITIATIIIGAVGILTLPSDVKLESVEFPRGTIKLDDKTLEVQIADTDSLRARGLMFQNELPYNEGMLFVFDESNTRPMWMLNMQFNLDIIWFDENSNVVAIEKDVPPCRTTIEVVACRENGVSGDNAKYVRYNMIEELWLIPLGFVAGVLGSIIGLGGGIIIVPVLTFMGFSPTLAVSNSLFAVFSNSVASTTMYARQKRIELSLGWKLGLMAVPGTILGAFISSDISPDIFKILFALVLISSASYIFLKRKIEEKPADVSTILLVFSAGASFFAGIISTLFGIGGGLIFVPLMVVALGISMKRAVSTSQFILMFASFSGLIMHSMLGHPDYYQALLLSIGAFAGGILGARLSLEIKENKLKIIVIIVLVAAAIKLIIDSTGIF